MVAVAENTADELARSDGREVQLEEDPDLQLPFLLPEDGYSCDVVRNIPNGLQEFLDPLCQRGQCYLCRLSPAPVPRSIVLVLLSRGRPLLLLKTSVLSDGGHRCPGSVLWVCCTSAMNTGAWAAGQGLPLLLLPWSP